MQHEIRQMQTYGHTLHNEHIVAAKAASYEEAGVERLKTLERNYTNTIGNLRGDLSVSQREINNSECKLRDERRNLANQLAESRSCSDEYRNLEDAYQTRW